MSAKRRREHKERSEHYSWSTAHRRRVSRCKSSHHWRSVVGLLTFSDFRRPIDQDAKVAFLLGRCHRCRIGVEVPIAIPSVVEKQMSEDQFGAWRESQIEKSVSLLRDLAIPLNVRRSVGWSPDSCESLVLR